MDRRTLTAIGRPIPLLTLADEECDMLNAGLVGRRGASCWRVGNELLSRALQLAPKGDSGSIP